MQKGDERLARDTKVIYGTISPSSNVRYVYPAESKLDLPRISGPEHASNSYRPHR